MKIFIFLSRGILLIAALAGCASIQSVSISDVPANSSEGKLIGVSESGTGLFEIGVPTLNLGEKLRKKCPEGAITSIQTALVRRDLFVMQFYEARMTALCFGKMVEAKKISQNQNP